MRTALLLACLFPTASHAVPGQFTHQGRLLDAEGVPLEGEATITFRVTDSESSGTTLWEDTLTVPLDKGFYSAILGADEEANPLDITVLSQAPVWLELQLDGEAAMSPRSPIHSVPYAQMATVAEEVAGGPVDASSIAIGGAPVISDAGEWVGPSPSVNWSDIAGMPAGFADGTDDDTDTDTDTLEALGTSCTDGNIPVWDATAGAWLCGIDADTQLTEEQVDAMVADNGYAMATDLFPGGFSDLSGIPTGLEDGDDDTQLTEEQVDAMVADNGYLTAADIGTGGAGTVIYTRCAWTGETMVTEDECTPPECPSPWEDLGITGKTKSVLTAYGTVDYDRNHSASAGVQERGCYSANPVAVLVTRCAWTGETVNDIETCTPPECPEVWSDLGITGNVKAAMGMWGSTDYDRSHSESSGYQERTCVR